MSVAGYASMAVAPLIASFPDVPPDPAPVLGVVAGVAAVALVGASATDDLAGGLASLSTSTALVAALFPGLGWLAVALALAAPGSAAAGVAVVGVASCLPGLAALWLAETETSRRRIDDATVHVRFGGDGPGRTALAGASIAALGAVGVAAAGLFDLVGDDGVTTLLTSFATLVTVGSTLLSAAGDDEDEDDGDDGEGNLPVAVTDAGIRIGDRLHGWEALTGYRVADDTIEVRRDTWFDRTLSFERDGVDDEPAVVDALGRYLPRVDDEGRVEMAAARGHGRSLPGDAASGRERRRSGGHVRQPEREGERSE